MMVTKNNISKIKIVLTDVDGVLTDGGMYYSSEGDIMKKFHARDGMGVTLLRKNEIPTIIVTKEQTEIVRHWSKKMKIKELLDGVKNKELVLHKICKKYNVFSHEVAYIGDDVNDIDLLKKVGFSACPKDGMEEVKKICNYTCKKEGGKGAFRELVELVLKNR
jgi:3-deoxy-D-manno-octulosonate 8-phosphate phosphatase (KDO 8-P phosphatase)